MLHGLTRPRVLLIEDDEDIRTLVAELLDFEVEEAATGAEGLTLAFASPPNLILLDRNLPDQDGLAVLAQLRAQLTTRHVPVILLTARGEPEERVLGLRSGAEDYICKPFNPAELVARVEVTLMRARDALVTDPLTKLPGNEVLRAEIARYLREGLSFSLCYADLNNFKAYVDHYGFERASELIQRLAQICYACLIDYGAPEDFLGHLGGDDFFFLTGPGRSGPLVANLLARFDEIVPGFYEREDLERGFIVGVDRFDEPREFPLTSLSVAVVDVEAHQFADPRELAAYAAKCKSEVKQGNEGCSNTGSFSRPKILGEGLC
tara:strand:- start:67 stop:1029 length:963 start_codon:yes stop_codon:yes gene_type:complete